MAYDGSITFSARIDTNDLNNGVRATENTVEQSARRTVQTVDRNTRQIETQTNETTQRIQAILNDSSISQRSQAMRISAIYRQQGLSQQEALSRAWEHIGQSATRTSQNIINTSQRTSDRITENARQVNRNIDNSTRTTSNRLLSTANGIVQRIRNRIRSASEQTREQVSGTVNHLENTFNGLKSKIIATFSTVAIINFGKQCIEASASVNALNSQIEQTFGSLKNQAEKAMQTVATESGIVETRLQSVGTSIYAFAKTSGMDSASALNMMKEALQVTADSAAYYDRSLEETAESLKSFLKGNYANDAALGISCTETTRNTAANKLYGKSFQELSEAQKQLTLLQMVKDANQLSGAMGQASREADGWENVIGNLKEAWKQFLAVVGQPILQVATQVVKNLSSALQKLTEYAKQTTNALSKVFGWDFGKDNSNSAVSDIADSTETLTENLDEADKSAKKLQKNLAGFDKLNILNSEEQESSKTEAPADLSSLTALENTAESTENTVDSIKNKLLGLFKNTSLESFFSEIKKGFDTINLKAIKNNVDGIFSDLRPIAKTSLDGVVKIAKSSMTTFGKVIGGTVSVTGKSLQTVTGGIAKWLDADKEKISNGIKEISDNLSSGIDNIGIFFDSIFGTLGASIDRMRPTMENAIAVFLGGFSDLGLAVGRIFSSAFDIATGILAQWAVSNEETIGAFFDNVQGTFAQVAELLGGIMTEISEILTGWWYNGGAVVWAEICRAVTDIGTTVMNVYNEWIQPAIDTVIGIVSDLWEYTLRPIFEQVISVTTKIGECAAALWSNVLSPVVNWLVEVLAPVVKNVLKVIRGVFQTVFKVIGDVISGFLKVLGGIIDFLTNVFKPESVKLSKQQSGAPAPKRYSLRHCFC